MQKEEKEEEEIKCSLTHGLFNLRCPVSKTGASDSIIVFAKKVIKSKPTDVVFKITADFDPKENALEYERKAYMFVEKVLSRETPHFAPGLCIGTCEFHELTAFGLPEFWENDFIPKWKQARGLALYLNKFTPEFKNQIKQRFQATSALLDVQYKDADEATLARAKYAKFYELAYSIFCENDGRRVCDQEKIHYVMTKKLEGDSLNDFITKNPLFSVSYDLDIAIQVAQAFAVAQKHGFMHNDCHPGNIFIRKRTDKELYKNEFLPQYKYPFAFSLKTEVVITIFDYDFSSFRGLENTSLTNIYCATSGTCDKFTKNYDWYYFLHAFVALITQFRKTILSDYLDKNPYDYHSYGRACKCIKENSDFSLPKKQRCDLCKLDTDALNRFITPDEFLKKQLQSNNSMTTPIEIEQQQKLKLKPKKIKPIVVDEHAKLVNPEAVLQEFLRFTAQDESTDSYLATAAGNVKMHIQEDTQKTQKNKMTLSQETAYKDFMKQPTDPIQYLNIVNANKKQEQQPTNKTGKQQLEQERRKKGAL